jgi:hypothetical protein
MLNNKVVFFLLAITMHLTINNITSSQLLQIQILNIHAFLFSIITCVFLIKKKHKTHFQKKIFSSLAINIFRAVLSIFFLWPIITSQLEIKKTYIIHFFISYFFYQYIQIYFYRKKKK